MNVDKETKTRFKRKLLNACNEIDGLVTFIEVHNEEPDYVDNCPAFRRGRETQNELEAMAKSLGRMFDKL